MTQQGVRWTSEQVLALAPDEASREAGSRLGVPGPWSGAGWGGRRAEPGEGAGPGAGEGTGGEAGGEAVWGVCAGSGRTSYKTAVDLTGPAYTCTCPSRKVPCKHVLGLLLLWAGDEGSGDTEAEPIRVARSAEAPDWVESWLAGRRARAAGVPSTGSGAPGTSDAPADPEAVRRRAERRTARITAGARELEQRLADLLRGGLATAEQVGHGLWEETAARMVDAQAPGLAARVRELGALPGSGPGWPVRLLEECALTHLLVQAWLSADRLPAPLAATVRTRVGRPATPGGSVLRDHWQVLAQYDSADARLTTRRIWLYGRDGGHTALLLSYGAAGRAPGQALPVGTVLDAELRPYEGGGPRAELVEQFAAPAPAAGPPRGGPVGAALAAYGRTLGDDPWLDAWPVTLTDVVPARADYGWQLADAGNAESAESAGNADTTSPTDATDTREAIPLTRAAQERTGLWRLIALSGGGPLTVFGEVGHRGFSPLAAWSPDAPEETVPLV
ncbi:SWIM zinc finger family protein [Streptomyces sp. NPDC048717]|uniref:SWIM zinc finger family protein n=1 Tax=Streptomyces sp. NPDC048717 TaxID=3154928 RepID=UPI00341FF955